MKTTQAVLGLAAMALFVAFPVFAKPDTAHVVATNTKSGRSLHIPAQAVEVADNVFYLGNAVDPASGKLVEGYALLNKRSGDAKGGGKGRPGGSGGGADTCYAFLADGAKWKAPEDYVIDSTNVDGLSDTFVRDAIGAAVNAWDSEVAADVFGSETAGVVDGIETAAPDGKNEVMFGDIDSAGTVGVTIVWGIFRGNPSQRQLVEWDQMYDDVDYDFGDAMANPSLIDFAGVAAHEVGHAAGMGHPNDSCAQETMYRFVAPGQTFQRDLHTGDIAGIVALY